MPLYRAAALTDIGRVRRQNEDRFVCDSDLHLFGVADGVGGLPGGAEAAELAINSVRDGVRNAPKRDAMNLGTLVQAASAEVAKLGVKLSPTMGIGTTLTIGAIRENVMKLAHVGDSRCYMARGREFIRLTDDHSVENEARLRRARGEVVYYHEANRNALTRCVGQPGKVEVDLISRPLAAGDRYLFCTDGLTRVVRDDELAERLGAFNDPEPALRDLISRALDRGAPDNVTAVLVFVDAS